MWGHDGFFFPHFFSWVEKKKRCICFSWKSSSNILVKTCIFKCINAECVCFGRICIHELLLSTFSVFFAPSPAFAFTVSLHFPRNPTQMSGLVPSITACSLWSFLCTIGAISNSRGGILWLVSLAQSSVCSRVYGGLWLRGWGGGQDPADVKWVEKVRELKKKR